MKRGYLYEEQHIRDFSPEQAEEAIDLIQSEPGRYGIIAVPAADPNLAVHIRDLCRWLPRLLLEKREKISEERIEKALELLMTEDSFAKVDRNIEFDNAELRADFFGRETCFNSTDIHEISHQGGKNKSMPASRWKKDGRIFAVSFHGQDFFPKFQFREGDPHPAMKKVLSALPKEMTPWQTAFWFTSENGWLNGSRPCDAIDDTDAVCRAAEMEGETFIG
ncbi:MAG: hypothetical protein IH994_02430 [Proteobacteria bacterium]|nr:hypothetical protein [Pseudomonadota bacterium]